MVADIDWPADVSQECNQNTLGEEDAELAFGFRPEFGPDKRRSRSVLPMPLVSYKRTMTLAEWDSLLAFYRATCVNGVKAFNTIHPRTHKNVVAQFTDVPKAQAQSHQFMLVSVSLLLLQDIPPTTIPPHLDRTITIPGVSGTGIAGNITQKQVLLVGVQGVGHAGDIGNKLARASTVYVEAVTKGIPVNRASTVYVEAVTKGVPVSRASAVYVEAVTKGVPLGQVSTAYVEVVVSVPYSTGPLFEVGQAAISKRPRPPKPFTPGQVIKLPGKRFVTDG